MADPKSNGGRQAADTAHSGVPRPFVPRVPVRDDPPANTPSSAGDAAHWWRAGEQSTPSPAAGHAGRQPGALPGAIPRVLAGQIPRGDELKDPTSPESRRARRLGWMVVGLTAVVVVLALLVVYLW